ncbi:DUF1816 domain-containing protein [Pantanalinema sp. GBBB05]|uniref:DUF1816 domain-containing protein n=1 Tax=Pantanalinema sp. GBBB05 TaxID=2604139 RepID=UPI001D1F9737|nr:DUF1816 domain-containing protein [Pantanalinema sp. GBBB05]
MSIGLLTAAKEVVTGFVQSIGTNWWLEVTTNEPYCVYYFGPFDKAIEAKDAASGYIQDLQTEGARGISMVIKRCKPTAMTICHEFEA